MRKQQDQTGEEILKHEQKTEYVQKTRPLTSIKKSWSTDSLSSLSGGRGACVCAPTKHEGSFRCRHHRNPPGQSQHIAPPSAHPKIPGCIEEEAK
ncbi:hypothetical protein J5N97_014562 [Dioscorea zingiberensis]|uniref:Uncharacterized protein n=1 Tax=Dioscorea zingiberensis TaxID=325984 RepID=A0A9D5CVF1_9LILI|nr:hypothetical protein J5N97_014562 [Dioscorea zingiberensis]